MRPIAFAALALAILAQPALAAAPDPSAPVTAFHTGLAGLTRTDRAADLRLVKRLAAKSFDVDAIVRGVMGTAYDTATPAQRAQLSDVFLRGMTARVEKEAATSGQMTVVKVTPAGAGLWLVATRTVRGTATSALTWRVRAEASGPKIIDVLQSGGSLVALQHNVFQQALRGHDVAWVIADMARRAG
jgi:ABC-type transporter MlaC component